jgi:hypothetical protein
MSTLRLPPVNREKVLEGVTEKLHALKGLRRLEVLGEEDRKAIMEEERRSEKMAKEGGLMPVYNEGVWTALRREVQVAMVLDADNDIISGTRDLLQLNDQKGRKLGEWVNEDRARELKGRSDVRFMSKDFVLYTDMDFEGEPFFVLPEVDFPYLDGVEGIKNVTSGSPSGLSDEYIKKQLGVSGSDLLTHIVGFDIAVGTPTI